MGIWNRRQVVLASLLVMGLGGGAVQAATPVSSTGNNFTMLDPDNGLVGGNNTTAFTWDGTYKIVSDGTANATIASTSKFFSFLWTAHNVEILAPGDYTFDTTNPAGNPESGMMTLTVGAGQVGAHMLFDWNGNLNIDVVQLWDIDAAWIDNTPGDNANGDPAGDLFGLGDAYATAWSLVSRDGNGDGFNGIPMATGGAFAGFNANFNIKGIVVPGSNIPVITVTGSEVVSLTVNVDTYTELGATASDTEDGNLTSSIVVGGDTVVTTTIGTYVVTYDVTDSTALTAVQKTRTVSVHASDDSTGPVITLLGSNPLNITLDSTYTDPGFTCIDDFDANCAYVCGTPGHAGPADCVTVGGDAVDTGVAGTYTVTYDSEDLAGNPALQKTRSVVVTPDTTPPVITLTGDQTMTVTEGDTYTDPGFTATDNIDGDLHASVVVGGQTVDTSTVGEYTVTYNVHDEAGNPAIQRIRTVNVTAACAVSGIYINNFTMYDDDGGIVGGSNTVDFQWDGSLLTDADVDPTTHLETVPGNATLSTTCLFFANPWTADPVWFFGPGTYTFDACPAGDIASGTGGAMTDGSSQCTPGDPATLITMTVGEGQVGAHMLFSWGSAVNIDMINVFDANAVAGGLMASDCGGADANRVWDLTSSDIDGDGIMGFPFVDGPFGGFQGNMNLLLTGGMPTDVPVLEIQGDNPLALAMGDTFTCPAAMAEDALDSASGPICDKITSVGCDNVDTDVPGAYTVTYQIVDTDGHKVSDKLLVIVFGPAEDVPTGNLAGANPLVTFGEDADHPVVIMNSALDVFGHDQTLINGDTTINVNPCVGRDCIGDAGFNVCTDPGATALDQQEGALTPTTTIEKLVGGGWEEADLDCSVPARFRITYTAADTGEDNGLEPGMVQGAAITTVYTTEAVRYFSVNSIPTADEQLPAEQSENADVGGGCSAGNGQNHPLQRADLLLLGGFLAALGLRRVKRSDV